MQAEPPSIPTGALVLLAALAIALDTVSAKVGVNVAVTAVSAVSVTVQGAVPEQAPPLQPVKNNGRAGGADSVTTVPLTEVVVKEIGQSTTVGVVVTIPAAAPTLGTVRTDKGVHVE